MTIAKVKMNRNSWCDAIVCTKKGSPAQKKGGDITIVSLIVLETVASLSSAIGHECPRD